jgi:cytochrome d ubiquinol oxidase subunit II
MAIDLVPIWTFILALSGFMYVLLDGFDLGVGIMFPFAADDDTRTLVMNTVAPIWDGNETWLVMGGIGLFAAFPIAFAIIIPAMYFPILLMLLGLIFRGVAFEFRLKAHKSRFLWNHAFFWGSLVATFSQGIVLGSFVQGFELAEHRYVGGPFAWLTPFCLVTGLALLTGYALLGSTWLVLKAPGALEAWGRRWSARLLLAVLVLIAAISVWVTQLDNGIAARWFSLPNFYFLSQVPLATAVVGYLHWRTTHSQATAWPFLLTMALFTLGYAGLAISLWPNIVPHSIPYWEAAAAATSQRFLGVDAIIPLPAVLIYTAYSYYVFRGKVDKPLHY